MASTNPKKAAQERAAALGGRDERYIAALETERKGYVMRGLPDRVAAVDEQLAFYRKGLGVKPAGRAPEAEPETDSEA